MGSPGPQTQPLVTAQGGEPGTADGGRVAERGDIGQRAPKPGGKDF